VNQSASNANDFFQTSGTLKADSPSYIERSADRELYDCVLAGGYAYVLTPRQMGKSSLMTRTAARLRTEGVHVAVLDLTGIGGDARSMSADEWYFGLANKMLRELVISYPLTAWWQEQVLLPPLNRLMNFFQDVVLNQLEGKIVVFVDEIDTTIKLPFSDDFFAAIRACFNARANQAVFDRICFVLLGVASPADLIRDPTRTPFNIGRRIDLTDFDVNEARHLIHGLHENSANAERLLKRVLYWTGGHPYLTQKLCVLSQNCAANEAPETRVDSVVKAEFLGVGQRTKEDNLKLIDDRIAKVKEHQPELLKVYAKVRKGKPVQDQPQSTVHSTLKLSGLVKADKQGWLRVRNEIYKQVFDARWINQLTPSRWPQRISVGSVVLLAAVFSWWIGSQLLTLASGTGIILAWLGIAYPEPDLVKIGKGSFLMGSPPDEKERGRNEGPQHRVTFTQDYFMGTHEVTFDEYDVFAFLIKHDGGCRDGHEVVRPSDSGWGRGNRPVINVSWEDVQCYAEWLSTKTNKNYRLPTEAEWEYSCRAGTSTPFSFGDNITPDQVNYNGDYPYNGAAKGIFREQTVPVKTLPANPWGLYEMHGNVWEWCSDWYGKYEEKDVIDPIGPVDGSDRVLRGGSWSDDARSTRSANRGRSVPAGRDGYIGFRLALGQDGVSLAGQEGRRTETGRTDAQVRGGQAGRSVPDRKKPLEKTP
jgi:formylglycine-generating enzyme required for sulfatase activity